MRSCWTLLASFSPGVGCRLHPVARSWIVTTDGGIAILVPVDFPDAPKINSASDAREASLVDLLDWRPAPANLAL